MHCTLNAHLSLREGHLLAPGCSLCWGGGQEPLTPLPASGQSRNCIDGGTVTGHLSCTSGRGRDVHIRVERQQPSAARTSEELPPSDGRRDPVLPKAVQVSAEKGVPWDVSFSKIYVF